MRQLPIIFIGLALTLVACSTNANSADSLPPGDAARGAALFTQAINGAPPCATCHTLDSTTLVGPSLKGFAAIASTRKSGTSARDYAYESIVRPPAYLVSGFGNLMYNRYAQRLSTQQIADLVDYLLTL
jgi:mono/diheme cytochrome c family protein